MTTQKLPVIQRDPYWCLLHLTTAMKCLHELCSSESLDGANEQLNLLKREELAGLFAVLNDYAEAIRLVLPEEIKEAA